MTYEVEARVVASGVPKARFEQGTVFFDTSPSPGAGLPGPAELRMLAFAACVLKNVERFAIPIVVVTA